ncbi:MAG: autotransporter-associated beta strand repeat-containing protein [Verrucomicrobiota bacterium]
MKPKKFFFAATMLSLIAATATPAYAQITVGGDGANTTDSTSYSGDQTLTKTGSNTVTLTGSSTYSGETTVSDGTLEFTTIANNAASALGTGADASPNGRIVIGGGNLRFVGNTTQTVDRNIAWKPGTSGILEASGSAGAALVINDTSGNPFYAPGTRTFAFGGTNTDANTYSGVLANQSFNASSLSKSGSGRWVLSGINTYTGESFINAGTLVAANNNALGAGGFLAGTKTTVADGATLALQGNISMDEHTHLYGSGVGGQGVIRNLSGTNSLTSHHSLKSNVALGADAGQLTISGNLYDEGAASGVTKVGAGEVVLSGSNTYTGATTVNGGRLQLGAGSSSLDYSSSSGYAINNGSTLALGGAMVQLNAIGGSARTITFDANGGNTLDTGSGVNVVDWVGNTYRTTGGARNFITGSSGLNVNSGATATLDVARGTDPTSDLTVSSFFWNAGGIAQTGNGIATLSGSSTYTGQSFINAGTLVAENNNALGAGGFLAGTKTTVADGATLALQGNISMNEHTHLYGNGVGGQGAIRNLSGNNSLTSNHALKSDVALGADAGQLTISGNLYDEDGTFGMTKVGAGAVVLSGNNTYSGDTVVNAGELKVNGSIANSEVTVNSGAVLSGSGTVGGISGAGSINPGNSPGILTAPWIDPSDGMFLNFEITDIKPEYSQATNSANDVLRLTAANPFAAAMDAGNQINVYFNVADFDLDQAFLGGIYTDDQADFTNLVSNATFNYYIQDDEGSISYNGILYSVLTEYDIELGTALDTANFADGTVNGRVMQFTVVPEPSSALLVLIAGGVALTRRRRQQTV